MKKAALLLALIILNIHLAQSLEVEKTEVSPVIISEISNPAIFTFTISNPGESQQAEIYSLVGVSISPSGMFELAPGDNVFEIRASPQEDFRKNIGYFTFEYQIKGQKTGIFKDNLLLQIVPLKDVFEIETLPISQDDTTAKIIIKNTKETTVNNVRINLDSSFFEGSKTLSFRPLQNHTIEVEINKNIARLTAGKYLVEAEFEVEGESATEENIIDYLEKEGTSVSKETTGFILRKTTTSKTNRGNVPVEATIDVKKDVLSRLFTINSPSPDEIERRGLSVTYHWGKTLAPGESLEASTTTNYTVPFILLLLIAGIGFGSTFYFRTPLAINKKVTFIRTRGGEFAMKVNIRVKARKNVEKINLVDSIPATTKLYEKFGKQPDKIDESTRRLHWNIEKLSKGEERFYSYIIYSKLKLVGRVALPQAHASFAQDGKHSFAYSNKAFLASEITR